MTNANATARTPDIRATIEGTVLSLAFSNGATVRLNAADLYDDLRMQAMMHGLKQKLVDAAAISRNPDTGRTASIQDKYDAVCEVHNRLMLGQWNKGRADGDGSGKGGLLYRALCRMYGETRTAEQVQAFLATKSKEEQAALRKVGKIAAIIEELKAESAKSGDIDADALLADL